MISKVGRRSHVGFLDKDHVASLVSGSVCITHLNADEATCDRFVPPLDPYIGPLAASPIAGVFSVASGVERPSVRIFKADARAPCVPPLRDAATVSIASMQFSQDGNQLVVLAGAPEQHSFTVWEWKRNRTSRVVASRAPLSPLHSVQFYPNLNSASADASVITTTTDAGFFPPLCLWYEDGTVSRWLRGNINDLSDTDDDPEQVLSQRALTDTTRHLTAVCPATHGTLFLGFNDGTIVSVPHHQQQRQVFTQKSIAVTQLVWCGTQLVVASSHASTIHWYNDRLEESRRLDLGLVQGGGIGSLSVLNARMVACSCDGTQLHIVEQKQLHHRCLSSGLPPAARGLSPRLTWSKALNAFLSCDTHNLLYWSQSCRFARCSSLALLPVSESHESLCDVAATAHWSLPMVAVTTSTGRLLIVDLHTMPSTSPRVLYNYSTVATSSGDSGRVAFAPTSDLLALGYAAVSHDAKSRSTSLQLATLDFTDVRRPIVKTAEVERIGNSHVKVLSFEVVVSTANSSSPPTVRTLVLCSNHHVYLWRNSIAMDVVAVALAVAPTYDAVPSIFVLDQDKRLCRVHSPPPPPQQQQSVRETIIKVAGDNVVRKASLSVLAVNGERLALLSSDGSLSVRSIFGGDSDLDDEDVDADDDDAENTKGGTLSVTVAHSPLPHMLAHERPQLAVALSLDCSVVATLNAFDSSIAFWSTSTETTHDAFRRFTLAAASAGAPAAAMTKSPASPSVSVMASLPAASRVPVRLVDTESCVPSTPLSSGKVTPALLEDALAAVPEREQLLRAVETIRTKVDSMVERNGLLSEGEQLARDDFTVDTAARERRQAAVDEQVRERRRQLEYDVTAQAMRRAQIRDAYWDQMRVRSVRLHGLLNTQMCVENFALPHESEAERDTLLQVKTQRRVERDLNKPDDSDDAEYDAPGRDGGDPLLLYSSRELMVSAERKRSQVVLLGDACTVVKEQFNNRFEAVVAQKRTQMARIKEKCKRIHEIQCELRALVREQEGEKEDRKQLQITSTVSLELLDDEVPERLFVVYDEEEEREEEEEEVEELGEVDVHEKGDKNKKMKRATTTKTKVSERALHEMMGGKLEGAEEDALLSMPERPGWMDIKARDEMDRGELQALKAWDLQAAAVKEEHEKRRRARETELRKLQTGVREAATQFDAALAQLRVERVRAEKAVLRQEWRQLTLQESVMREEALRHDLSQVAAERDILVRRKAIAAKAVMGARGALETHQRDELEVAQAHNKELERAFKRELRALQTRDTLTNDQADALYRVYRATRRSGAQATVLGVPTGTTVRDERAVSKWLREACVQRVESERHVKSRQEHAAELQRVLDQRLGEELALGEQLDVVLERHQHMEEVELRAVCEDMSLMLELRQGQVEVVDGTTDDVVVVERQVVERLNEEILRWGAKKVEIMREMKDFRKGIVQLEWDNRRVEMLTEDIKRGMRNMQLTRVTKQMQESAQKIAREEELSGGQGGSSEVDALRQLSVRTEEQHRKVVDEKTRQIRKLKKRTQKKVGENSTLSEQVQLLQSQVMARTTLNDLHTSAGRDGGARERMRAVVTRRGLVETVKEQQQEIEVLRKELERLQMRTFPMFD